jgi:hypothetical protein
MALPADQRQIKPIEEQKGVRSNPFFLTYLPLAAHPGSLRFTQLAGGLKYRVGNVFFKYAHDVHGCAPY